jgi:hypothetical protein
VNERATRAYLTTLYLLGMRGQELAQALDTAVPEKDRGIHLRWLELINSEARETRLQAVAPVLRLLAQELEARSLTLAKVTR